MADQNIKVSFSAEDKNFSAMLAKVPSEVAKMYERMNKEARTYSTSSKEIVRSIEDQIKALERKSAIERQKAFTEYALQAKFDPFKATKEERERFKSGLSEISMKYDNTSTISLLKEMLEAQKRIINDNKKNIKKSKADDRRFYQNLGDIVKTIQGYATAPTSYQGFAKALPGITQVATANPLINAVSSLIGGVLEKGFGEAMKYEGALSPLAIGSGMGSEDLHKGLTETRRGWIDQKSIQDTLEPYGITKDQYATFAAQMGRSTGNLKNPFAYSDLMLAGKGFMLDPTQISTYGRSNRKGLIQGGVGNIQNLYKATGGESGLADMPQYLAQLVSLNQQQLAMTGKTHDALNTRLIGAIYNMGFKDPVVSQTVMNGLVSGAKESNVDQVRSMQFGVLSRKYPGKSLWDYQKMMETPSPELISSFLKETKRIGGGNIQRQARLVSDIFFGGKNLQISEDIVRGNFSPSKAAAIIAGGGDRDYKAAAKRGTGTLEEDAASRVNTYQNIGTELTNFTVEIKEGIQKMVDDYQKLLDKQEEINKKIQAERNKIDEIIEKAIK